MGPQLQAMQKNQVQNVSPQHTGLSSQVQPGGQLVNPSSQQQHPFAMSNPNALAFANQQIGVMDMIPYTQMTTRMVNRYNNPMAMQSVMRNPSPGPAGMHGQGSGFMNMSGQF